MKPKQTGMWGWQHGRAGKPSCQQVEPKCHLQNHLEAAENQVCMLFSGPHMCAYHVCMCVRAHT